MINEWTYIDKIDVLPASDFVHCDTRDFHILCRDSELGYALADTIKKIRDKFGYGTLNDCKFNRSEILGCLKALEVGSGGKLPWRMLKLETDTAVYGWVKYIRFVKIPGETVELAGGIDDVYFAYMTTGDNIDILTRDLLVPENIKRAW